MNRNLFTFIMLFMLFIACKKEDSNDKTPHDNSGAKGPYIIDTAWRTNNELDAVIKKRALKYQHDYPDRLVGFRNEWSGKLAELGITDTTNSRFMTFTAYYRKKYLDSIIVAFREALFGKDSLAKHSYESIVAVVATADNQQTFRYTERSLRETVPLFLHERFKAFAENNRCLDYEVYFYGNPSVLTPGVKFKLQKELSLTDMAILFQKAKTEIFCDGRYGFAEITLYASEYNPYPFDL